MKRVLIVDDSQLSRNYHSFILTGAGYEVETARDGAEALEKVLSETFQAILTDINMRGMDGYEFIRRVRGDQQLVNQPPIIIISTESSEEDKQIGFKAGANFYLVKPAEPQELLASLRMITEG